jgi:hypothetical protein
MNTAQGPLEESRCNLVPAQNLGYAQAHNLRDKAVNQRVLPAVDALSYCRSSSLLVVEQNEPRKPRTSRCVIS